VNESTQCRMNPHQPGSRRDWPADYRISGAGYQRVEGTVSCVLTRFQLPSIWSLARFFMAFRRVRKQALSRIPGLIKAVFLVEGPHTCYTLSLWADDNSIVDFGTHVTSHISVANWGLTHVFRKDLQRPEIWSVHWRLWAISHNLNWEGVDLRQVLAKQSCATMKQSGSHIVEAGV
jgi:hypothetical protein